MGKNKDARYPIGREEDQPYFLKPFDDTLKDRLLMDIKMLPATLEMSIENLDAALLAMPYREGGWTINQLVHHVADSHMMAYARFKWGLTESDPVIKTYDQDAWAALSDTREIPINVSLTLLHALHQRWFVLMKSLDQQAWERNLFHPEKERHISLWQLLKSYAWHGKHHVAQIMAFRNNLNSTN